MKKKQFLPFFLILLFFLISCSSAPYVKQFPTDNGFMYFVHPTDWKTKANDKASLDITYHTGTDLPPAVNISFWGKKTAPRVVTNVALIGPGLEYHLVNTRVLFVDIQKRQIRITTEGNRDNIFALLEADSITLNAEIDGVKYTFTTNKTFYNLKNELLTMLSY